MERYSALSVVRLGCNCRVCGTPVVIKLDLGLVASPGIFHDTRDSAVGAVRDPLAIGECPNCNLVQLATEPNLNELYGPSYGYRSSLNKSMVDHLYQLTCHALGCVELEPGDRVLDIGSNDGTTLRLFERNAERWIRLFGIDPLADQMRELYPTWATAINGFFDYETIWQTGAAPFKIITSIAMFYDLPDPVGFARDVKALLHPKGVWLIEVADWPSLATRGAFDTVCPEHLEYYSVSSVLDILSAAGLQATEAFNTQTNGASIVFVVRHPSEDQSLFLEADTPHWSWVSLKNRVEVSARNLRDYLDGCSASGKRVAGYGASTKGNVLLQVAGITAESLPIIAEVNADKFGKYTPGTGILIDDESVVRKTTDAFVVLPWHFEESIVQRERAFLESGGELYFPLPDPHIVRL